MRSRHESQPSTRHTLKRFTQLFTEVEQTNRTTEKQAALERYFREVSPKDAMWALYFLTERRLKRLVNTR